MFAGALVVPAAAFAFASVAEADAFWSVEAVALWAGGFTGALAL